MLGIVGTANQAFCFTNNYCDYIVRRRCGWPGLRSHEIMKVLPAEGDQGRSTHNGLYGHGRIGFFGESHLHTSMVKSKRMSHGYTSPVSGRKIRRNS